MKYLCIEMPSGRSYIQFYMDEEALACLQRVEGERVVYKGQDIVIVEMPE